ncbi:MAG TPA: M20/M25/M40 family metallo-hydrolase [Myxococcaceae bacterium]|nr:M20/M25/M40 family metallo-hydrolase [Myxococcaceae bacterium]
MGIGRGSRGTWLIAGAFVLLGLEAMAQDAGAPRRTATQQWRASHATGIVRELADFVALPNVASDKVNIEQNARVLMAMLKRRGIEPRLLQEPGAPPAVFGELRAPAAKQTVVFYAHYDGQPVDATQWTGSPWKPVLRDNALEQGGREIPFPAQGAPFPESARLYGRSTSDDKAAIIAMLSALDALRAASLQPSVNLKFFFEGEEEAGSPHLRDFLEHNRELLKADAWIFCDGPVHQSRQMQIVYGVRGSMGLELTVYGATRSLHSGHYGNWAPNPAAILSQLLSAMRDDDGRVQIAGFYDPVKPLTESEKRAISAAPNIDVELRQSLGLASTEAANAPLAERIFGPAMNIRGLLSGHVGAQASNAIPTEARASIDFRLVPDQTTEGVKAAVERHLKGRGYYLVHEAPDAATRLAHARIVRVEWQPGYPGVRTSMQLPLGRAVTRVVREAIGSPIVELPNMGGSLPLYLLQDVLATPFLIVPIANHDNNQHAANENLRLRNLWDGIDIFVALFSNLGPAWGAEAPRPR